MPSRRCCTAEGGITGGTLDVLSGETKSRMRRMLKSSSSEGSSSSWSSSSTLEMTVVEKEPGSVDGDT